MQCDHIAKILKWSYELEDGQMNQKATLFGCTLCDETTDKLWDNFGVVKTVTDHKVGDFYCECFGCKAKSLQLNAGDATRDISDKKWTSELKAYKQATEQGIKPAGTSRRQVEEAHKASELLNRPYDSGKMPAAKGINKKSAEVMKELGV